MTLFASMPKQPTTDFDAFWSLYPKKVAKGAARKAWRLALKKANRHACAEFLKALIQTYGPPIARAKQTSDEAAAIQRGCRMTQYGSEQRRTYGGVSA